MEHKLIYQKKIAKTITIDIFAAQTPQIKKKLYSIN